MRMTTAAPSASTRNRSCPLDRPSAVSTDAPPDVAPVIRRVADWTSRRDRSTGNLRQHQQRRAANQPASAPASRSRQVASAHRRLRGPVSEAAAIAASAACAASCAGTAESAASVSHAGTRHAERDPEQRLHENQQRRASDFNRHEKHAQRRPRRAIRRAARPRAHHRRGRRRKPRRKSPRPRRRAPERLLAMF